jgi:glutathione synthase
MVEGSQIFQIELNTISASLAGLSTKLTELQCERHPTANIPVNRACYGIGEAFNQAVRAYKEEYGRIGAVLFIIQDGERNFHDQLHLQNSIDSSIPILRQTLEDPSIFKVSDSDGTLTVNDQEIAVVYYRAGYSPDEYKTFDFWASREILESSRAIKCPDIASHLAGLKKIQQVLTSYEYLLKTMQNDQILTEELLSTFAGIYSLDATEEGERNVAMAMADPEKFVLKPQREGGGNNFYGQQVRAVLLSMSPQERSAFILMDRIRPSITPNCQIIRSSHVKEIYALSELGIYGTILAKGDDILLNEQVGWLLRTKPEESDEGGVVSGYSVLDTPSLS